MKRMDHFKMAKTVDFDPRRGGSLRLWAWGIVAVLGVVTQAAEADTSVNVYWNYGHATVRRSGSTDVSLKDQYTFDRSPPGDDTSDAHDLYWVDAQATASASEGLLTASSNVTVFAARNGYTGNPGTLIASTGSAGSAASYGSIFQVQGPWEEGTLVELPVMVILSGGYSSTHAPIPFPEQWTPAAVTGAISLYHEDERFNFGLAITPFENTTSYSVTIETFIGAEWSWRMSLSANAYADAAVRESGSAMSTSSASGTLSLQFGDIKPVLAPMYRWVRPGGEGLLAGSWGDDDRWHRGHVPSSAAAGVLFDADPNEAYHVSLGVDRTVNRLHVGDDTLTLDLSGSTLRLLAHQDSDATLAMRIGLDAADAGSLMLQNGSLIADQDIEVQSAAGASATFVIKPNARVLLNRPGPDDPVVRVGTYGGGGEAKLHVQIGGDSTMGRLRAGSLIVASSGEAVFDYELLVGDVSAFVSDPHANFSQHVHVADGGSLTASLIAVTGEGTLTLTGNGSRGEVVGNDDVGHSSHWELGPQDAALLVGALGNGQMTVSDGASFNADLAILGYDTGSTGRLTVSGSSASLRSNLSLVVGREGRGEVLIADGGTLTSDRIDIGERSGGHGVVTLTGAGATLISSVQGVRAGYNGGVGELAVQNGAQVDTLALVIGDNGTGHVTADGAGTLLWAGALHVGVNGGNGTLTITNGAQASGLSLVVGADDGQGVARFIGAGTIGQFDNNIAVGVEGATGLMEISGGAAVSTEGLLNIGSGSTVSLINGSLTIGSGNIEAGGRIIGVGTLTVLGPPLVNHGHIAPGLSPGHLIIEGDVVFEDSSVLEMEIAGIGDGQFDVLTVTGELTMGGTLVLRFIDGFAPKTGQTFDLLTAGTLHGSFDVVIENLADDFEYEFTGDSKGLSLVALTDGTFVPEPMTVMVLLSALTGVCLRRQR